MKQLQTVLEVDSPGRGLVDVTRAVQDVVACSGIRTGLAVVFVQHTSCSLLIQENADTDVQRDLLDWLARLAPDGDPAHRHVDEGPDDMPSHLRAAITRTSEAIPVVEGKLALGTWQALYLAEHRHARHRRKLLVHVTGE